MKEARAPPLRPEADAITLRADSNMCSERRVLNELLSPPPSFSFFFKEILSQDPDYSLLVQDFRSAFVRPRQAQNYYYYS